MAAVDLSPAMQPQSISSKHLDQAERKTDSEGVTLGHLAHELNSLLDGSLRSLRLAEDSVAQIAETGSESAGEAAASLRRAHESLAHMARLLDRAMVSGTPELALFDERMSLARQVQEIVDAIRPWADEQGIGVVTDMTPRAASLNSAALGTVILNGLRNAMQACMERPEGGRRVELSIALSTPEQLLILISDTGPGVHEMPETGDAAKAAGHGLGLDLSRRIVASLGGDLSLTTVPFGTGAVLQVRVPVRRLACHA